MLKQKARLVNRIVYLAARALTSVAFFAAFALRNAVFPLVAPSQFPTGLYPLTEYLKVYPLVLIIWSVLLFTYHSYHSHRTIPLNREVLTTLRIVLVGNVILATLAYLLPLRQEERERGEDDVADQDDAEGRQHLPVERDGPVAVIAVIGEQQ